MPVPSSVTFAIVMVSGAVAGNDGRDRIVPSCCARRVKEAAGSRLSVAILLLLCLALALALALACRVHLPALSKLQCVNVPRMH